MSRLTVPNSQVRASASDPMTDATLAWSLDDTASYR
eukprot:CAMPEP_0113329318 /NCGR_PEP_ID=MMETSP0010_2-20120614/20804_1 /TAXON_ID=216773 ORGANISM="Corethron hystrix, Strain 308" /NCGR_SAMPLE_ID=MMETSP0010_2 /ASSEMBLY_ACC=CAM_ASM_000155 /LENGTH=35 /DNA_ID=CAMNT_0000191335 /DNA_START=45 /DNA_END=152 /DNA_ORIENTATION=- /assembly_acc=CAM_ASM_000155